MRVAVIADVRGWAFDNILKGIIKYNPDPDLQIDVFYEMDLRGNRQKIVGLTEYDLLYPFSLYQAGFLWREGFRDYITMCHMGPLLGPYLPPGELPCVSHYDPGLFRAGMQGCRFGVVSLFLAQVWEGMRPDVQVLRVGVDPDIFYLSTAKRVEGPLRVGWVGNSEKPYKRFELVEAATDCEGIELHTVNWRRTHGDTLRSYAQMGDFYRSIDVYLCTSDHEGLPTPMIEAAACGVPVVSVLVGVVPEFVADGETGFIVSQDTVQTRQALVYLRDHPKERQAMGLSILQRAKKRLWPVVVSDWIDFIRSE